MRVEPIAQKAIASHSLLPHLSLLENFDREASDDGASGKEAPMIIMPPASGDQRFP